jgi:hypothetical protein
LAICSDCSLIAAPDPVGELLAARVECGYSLIAALRHEFRGDLGDRDPLISRQPVLDLEIWDAAEVTDVGGDHDHSPGQRDRGDAQVGLVQPPALGVKSRPEGPHFSARSTVF